MESPRTVFVVEDDQSTRLSVIALLEAHAFVCQGFDSAGAFLDEYDPQRAGCLVVDLDMPGMTGLELHRELQQRGWIIPTVVTAGFVEISQTAHAMQQGVIAVLEKPFEQDDLLEDVRRALEADSRLRTAARKLAELNGLFSQLTEEEVELLERVAFGKSNNVIAAELDVAVRTIENRRERLLQKLGVKSVGGLIALIVERDQLLDHKPDIRALAEASYRPET